MFDTKSQFLSNRARDPRAFCSLSVSEFSKSSKTDGNPAVELLCDVPGRESHFGGLHGRLAGVCWMVWGGGKHLHSPKGGGNVLRSPKGGGVMFSILNMGSCSPNFDQGDVALTVSRHCFLLLRKQSISRNHHQELFW